MLEVLAGVPTIVYGYFALETVTPFLQKIFPDMGIFNALSAGLVVGIMVLPMISSLSEDAMRAVPKTLRHGAYALGATRFEVALKIVACRFIGVVSSFVLAFSRAIGETMIVTVVRCCCTESAGKHSDDDFLYCSGKHGRRSARND